MSGRKKIRANEKDDELKDTAKKFKFVYKDSLIMLSSISNKKLFYTDTCIVSFLFDISLETIDYNTMARCYEATRSIGNNSSLRVFF